MGLPTKKDAQRQLILETAFGEFRRFGLRRVTQAEVAAQLGISKKTLYQHFASKEDLVRECVETHVVAKVLPKVAQAMQREGSAAERMADVWQAVSELPRLITPQLMTDLKSEYPHLWQHIDTRRREVIQSMEALLEQGRRNGEVRPEVLPAVVVRIMLAIAERLLVPEVMFSAPFSPSEAIDTIMTLLMRGAFVHPPDDLPEKHT